MSNRQRILFILCFSLGTRLSQAAAADVRWLLEYQGNALPQAPWTAAGQPKAALEPDALRLTDDGTNFGCYRANWKFDPTNEIIVEATVRVLKTKGAVGTKPDSQSVWPWRDGAPISVLVGDGKHQEGLVLYPNAISTWTDRFALCATTNDFHTYRLTIRGTDMSVAVDGEVKIKGQGAFWKPAESRSAFLQFGSNSKHAQGDALWKSVRLGVRPPSAPAVNPPVTVKLSEPWPIARPDLKIKPTRPYLARLSDGRLLMSVAQGPDAIHEPYGVMLSSDEGKTWSVVKDCDQTPYAPLPMIGLKDGSVLGMSRWTWVQPDGSYLARTIHWTPDLSKFGSVESRLFLPDAFRPQTTPFTCERHVFLQPDNSLLMAGYSKTGPHTPEADRAGRRYSHLLRSADEGKTWQHFATVGAGGEPAIAATGPGQMTAILRTGPFRPLHQTFSTNSGQTWTTPVLIEEGSVCPDLVVMSNGLLACSFGRPANSLMFSPDAGKTWNSHHVITDKTGFNYSAIVEVRPGRLLYVHDAGGLQALYVDVAYRPPRSTNAAAKAPASKP